MMREKRGNRIRALICIPPPTEIVIFATRVPRRPERVRVYRAEVVGNLRAPFVFFASPQVFVS